MIFLDTETTGLLNPEANDLNKQPYITELYMVKLEWDNGEFQFIDEFHSLFNVPVPIEPIITKITGIDEKMLEGQPTFPDKYMEIAKFFLGEDTVVGHNLAFDNGMIWTELSRIQCETKFPWPIHHHCTVELSLPIEHHRLKLSDLHTKATGAPHDGAHRARSDVEALVTCYAWLKNEGYIL